MRLAWLLPWLACGWISWCVRCSTGLAVEPFVAGYDRFYATGPSNDSIDGYLLLTELSCTACHSADKSLAAKGGPELRGIGSRLQSEWIREYLIAPGQAKPGGVMPHLLQRIPVDQREDAIAAIVAFLSSGDRIEPTIKASGAIPVTHEFWLKGNVERGRVLYHQMGCIACHAIDDSFQPAKPILSDLDRKIESLGLEPEELEEMGLVKPKPVRPIPMSPIEAKYSLRSLSMFLLDPALIRPASRMPHMKLQPHEAADIAAYLFRNASPAAISRSRDPMPTESEIGSNAQPAALIAKGRQLFEQLACVNCHSMEKLKPSMAKPLAKLNVAEAPKGCLAREAGRPQYEVTAKQVESLQRAIAHWQTNKALDEAEQLSLTLLQLNCYACHERGGRGGVGPAQWPYFENVPQVDIGDEGRMPPPLDHVGSKLSRAWMQKVLEGKGDVRPHFRARMPIFNQHAKKFSAWLHDVDTRDPLPGVGDVDIADAALTDVHAGRELLDTGCVQCHALRGESMPGAIGIDLADVGNRLNPKWFHAFLLNPAGLKKNTRMPSFFPDGQSSNPHILNGHVERQIASIWNYLNAKDQPLPRKIEQSKAQYFELKPVDKPIVLRTFMEADSAGTHAIAVGFPVGIHYAFDAKKMRVAEIWKGAFLNAQGTWFDRFAPAAVPLGTHRLRLPDEVWFETRESSLHPIDDSAGRFRGYRLDAQGVPTLLYQVYGFAVEDRIEPESDTGFLRQMSISWKADDQHSHPNELWLVVSDDAKEVNSESVCKTNSGLRLQLSPSVERRLQRDGESWRWVARISKETSSVEVRYAW